MPLARTGGGELGVRAVGGDDRGLAAALARIDQTLADILRELREDKIQRAEATRQIVRAEMATLEAVRRNRPPLIDAGPGRRMTV